MLKKYHIRCASCNVSFSVQYGTVEKEICYEIFSCPICKNLFSLTNREKAVCLKCNNTMLKRYNPNKKKNLEFFNKMHEEGLLTSYDHEELKRFWVTILDNECPCCGQYTLVWEEENEKNM
ncbi:hypothetical protein JW930_02330 [Candidatus Woesearchaeota archaeon]|nr:hypothetical protein [Candidatus Woesearchaeota archaeon]